MYLILINEWESDCFIEVKSLSEANTRNRVVSFFLWFDSSLLIIDIISDGDFNERDYLSWYLHDVIALLELQFDFSTDDLRLFFSFLQCFHDKLLLLLHIL
jgi:hypothetical protein